MLRVVGVVVEVHGERSSTERPPERPQCQSSRLVNRISRLCSCFSVKPPSHCLYSGQKEICTHNPMRVSFLYDGAFISQPSADKVCSMHTYVSCTQASKMLEAYTQCHRVCNEYPVFCMTCKPWDSYFKVRNFDKKTSVASIQHRLVRC